MRVNAPVLLDRAVPDVALTSFEFLRGAVQFQKVFIVSGLSYEVRARVGQRLDLTHR